MRFRLGSKASVVLVAGAMLTGCVGVIKPSTPPIEVQRISSAANNSIVKVTTDREYDKPFSVRVGETLFTAQEWSEVNAEWFQSNKSFTVYDPTEHNKVLTTIYVGNRYPIEASVEYGGKRYRAVCIYACIREASFSSQRRFKFFLFVDGAGKPLDQIFGDDGRNRLSNFYTRDQWAGVFKEEGIEFQDFKSQDYVASGTTLTYKYIRNKSDGSALVQSTSSEGRENRTGMKPNIRLMVSSNTFLHLEKFNPDGSVSFSLRGDQINP